MDPIFYGWRAVFVHFLTMALCAISVLVAGCASYPPSIDDEIQALRAEVDGKRATLTRYAQNYRATPGQDFEFDVSARPIKETIDTFNALSASDRTMSMFSRTAGGRFGEAWTDCPWPLSGHLGIYLEPARFPKAFGTVVYIDKFDYQGWHPTNGLEFAFRGVAGAGYIIVFGGVDYCFGSADILPIPVVVVGYTYYASGGASLVAVPNEGVAYKIRLTQPLYFLAVADVLGWIIPAPLFLTPELFSGKVPNIVGKEGDVQVAQTGKVRKYTLDIDFNQASFVNAGLTASGALTIKWQ